MAAHAVRGPKHSQKWGKTPVLQADEARTLIDAIDATSLSGLRDRALIGLMVYRYWKRANMGMGPITDISVLTLAQPSEPALEPLLAIVKVKNSSRDGDETYSPSDGKSAGESEDQHDDLPDDAETKATANEQNQPHQISFFA